MYENAFLEAPIGLVLYRADSPPDVRTLRQVAVNHAASNAAGRDMSADNGRLWAEISPEILDSEFASIFERVLATGEPASWEVKYGDAVYREAWYRGSARRTQKQDLLVAFENITEHKEAENALKRAHEELKRSNDALDEFAYVASHDLKAPLRDVDNLATWIAEDCEKVLPRKSQKHLLTLVARVRRMEALLDDLLDYSRAGRLLQPTSEYDVTSVVEEAQKLSSVPEGMVIDVASPSVLVSAPREPLAQILRNLIGNAVKHHDRPTGTIRIGWLEKGERVEFEVADDGPGISPEFHERIFQMFQTLRPRDEVEGTGMGLALVKKLVEAYGGTVSVDSDGRGTTFRFTWPKAWRS